MIAATLQVKLQTTSNNKNVLNTFHCYLYSMVCPKYNNYIDYDLKYFFLNFSLC